MPDVAFDAITTPTPSEFEVRMVRVDFDAPSASGGGSGGAPPSVSIVSPLAGGLDLQQPVIIDVADSDSAIRRVMLVLRVASLGMEEVIFQGERFAPQYAAQSSRAPITNGFRFTIRRAGGWPGSPSIDVYAVDVTGQES